jgi:hypothetical protein
LANFAVAVPATPDATDENVAIGSLIGTEYYRRAAVGRHARVFA